MAILALYDVMGIQKFIFGSKKLKENIGASEIVRSVIEDDIAEIMKEIFDGKFYSGRNKDELQGLQMKNGDIDAELIYAGGGNAMMIFDESANAVAFTKKFSEHILKVTAGQLKVAVEYLDVSPEKD